ncbi:hypothetical protein [Olleya namhaensis]|uniref:hypothetical protein n=1 Tax=Olleya namhaensis TaxID=1144750 RepID=UPI0024934AC8|nr:hypothetical protein [Olleya namhaensis]
MHRPKIKIEKNVLDRSIEVFTCILILISASLILIYYNQLPEKIQINFNWPSKDENGFGTKNTLWASPIICGIIAISIYKLNQYPWVFNYPVTITTTNAKYNYKMATQMLRLIGLTIGVMCLTITVISIFNSLGKTIEFQKYTDSLFPIILVGIPTYFIIKIIKNTNN